MYKVQILPKAEEDICTKSAPPLRCAFCASIAALLPHEEVSRICNIQKHARSPLTAGHASAGTGEYEEQNGTAKEQYGVDDGLSEDMQRADHRGHSEDKQDVEQVGADGIAQRQPAVSLFVATMEVTSSGREVPMAIMVSPMKFWLTPNS